MPNDAGGEPLGRAIAIMNAKGGVGKSTATLAISETLAYFHGKKVLVIDSDAQMSISVMLMAFGRLNALRDAQDTLVGFLHDMLMQQRRQDWKDYVCDEVRDVDEVGILHLLPGDLRLSLLERAVAEFDRHDQLHEVVRRLLRDARRYYEFILIDCPPGLSLLTEIWLREADFQLAPVRPDFLAVAGLEMYREFCNLNPEIRMAKNIGILVNMKHMHAPEDDHYHRMLALDKQSHCFSQAIPYSLPTQHTAQFCERSRSYAAKYPGAVGNAYRLTVNELLRRVAAGG